MTSRLGAPHHPSEQPSLKFGLLSPATIRVDQFMNLIAGTRTREMLVEDLMGFGVLRTAMDLFRGYFYGDEQNGPFNWPMARERLIREAGSIFTDNISSGLAAFGMGLWLDRRWRIHSNHFTDFNTLELFKDVACEHPNEQGFLSGLAHRLSESRTAKQPTESARAEITSVLHRLDAQLSETLTSENPSQFIRSRDIPKEIKAKQAPFLEEAATDIAKALGQDHYDVQLPSTMKKRTSHFNLTELMEDYAALRHQRTFFAQEAAGMVKQAEGRLAKAFGHFTREFGVAESRWQKNTLDLINTTLKAKNIKMNALAVGFGLTFAVPYFIRWTTKKLDNIHFYPGELGLGQRPLHMAGHVTRSSGTRRPALFNQLDEHQPDGLGPTPISQAEHWFPYLTRSARKGNFTPILASLIPLPVVVGMLDTVNLRFNNPFRKGFKNLLRDAYDFGKGAPFTKQQQMASMFAFLIMSRLTSSRSDNEFRERLVDSLLGWTLWILGTPAIKKLVAIGLEKSTGTSLLKQANPETGFRGLQLKSKGEIETFLKNSVGELTKLGERSKSQIIWIGAISTGITMLMLGLVEPYIAIQWTKRRGISQDS